MIRIDAHLHLWDLSRGGYSWLGPEHGGLFRSFGAEEARAELVAAGIDGAILVQADDSREDTESMLAVARENPWVVGIVGWVPLDRPECAAQEIERAAADPLVCGLRHLVHDDPRDDFLALPSVRSSLMMAARAGLAFDVPDAWPRHLTATIGLARELPELTLVLDHLGKPPLQGGEGALAAWRRELRALGELPNAVAKVSGLRLAGASYTVDALRGVWHEALDAFGPERLMLGSDWPVSTLGGPYGETLGVLETLASELSPDEQAWLDGRSAAAAYGLSAYLPR
ncbi:amidohydrolase family protein [Sinomonas sp. JGH33]|uniref:Amidohydrolase family protein n=1 Tax=Sinomonas terricola TaxID=3110330 RepID=A0ABU5T7S3_9MICC|nr:amidohydrolase family protein [Sinomonas sp. JGH33]MEA5455501.1 amidohydrolase family protein [Sinomonas sp. JGH33]